MEKKELIGRLCALTGIRRDYLDHLGRRREISWDSLSAVLETRGFAVDSEDALAASIAELENARGDFTAPPVRVLRDGRARRVALDVPRNSLDRTLAWRLLREDGETAEGSMLPSDNVIDWHERHARCDLTLDVAIPPGYHWLTVRLGEQPEDSRRIRLIVAPAAAFEPADSASKEWGVSVQLYALRSSRNWGIGDFTDLRNLAVALAATGADFVGINPIHALYPSNPEHASPYSPASRAFINHLYIDVEAVEDFSRCGEAREKVDSEYFRARLDALRSRTHVDYSGVAFLKLVVLRHLYESFKRTELASDSERALRFLEFCDEGGAALEELCVFYTLYAHHRKASRSGGWRNWPPQHRNPEAPETAEFAEANADTVRFYMYLQWLADEQLAAAHRAARVSGMRTGIYRDLAVGIDANGADMWRNRTLYRDGASVGAPPDALALQGQDWGLPPMEPRQMQAEGYATFITDLRDNMRHCGALRLDHAMQLMRLWWTPAGRPSSEGAYVSYPLADLLGIVALESHRKRCRIIGEDLGVVPQEIREAMPRERIWSYKVVLFEKNAAGQFKAPSEYAPHAMATLTTHDLPTMPGFWKGKDLLLRERLGLFPSHEIKEECWRERIADREALIEALKKEGIYPEGLPETPDEMPELPGDLLLALEEFMANSASHMVCVQLEDWLGIEDPVNVPGTSNEYPNWRRRLSMNLEEIFDSGLVTRHARALTRTRALRPAEAGSEEAN